MFFLLMLKKKCRANKHFSGPVNARYYWSYRAVSFWVSVEACVIMREVSPTLSWSLGGEIIQWDSVQHNPLPCFRLQVNLAKKLQLGKQNKTLTHLHSERPNQAWRYWKYFTSKSRKEKCWSEAKQQFFIKYYVKICFIPKLFSKVWE